jgi:SAM-dependent methyltransferase
MAAMYGERLRQLFPSLAPRVADLYLLEAHQVAGLPGRAPAAELAAVLHAHPALRTHLETRHSPIEPSLADLLARHGRLTNGALATAEELLLWEIAYQRAPEACDEVARRDWDPTSITNLVDVHRATVIDAGAGTGLVAFSLAREARTVFAVEPVASLRAYMRSRAARLGLGNVYAVDGMLDAIPLPPGTADVLVTCRAIGWDLAAELAEVERVLRPDGIALHLVGRPWPAPEGDPLHLALTGAGYTADAYDAGSTRLCRYWRRWASGTATQAS